MQTIFPFELYHLGKKRSLPSRFYWRCECGIEQHWQTKVMLGVVPVECRCGKQYLLDKSKPEKVTTNTGVKTKK